MLIFYLISCVINVAIAAGFFFRFRQTQIPSYRTIGLAVLANAVAAGLLAFLGDMIFGSFIVSLAIIYGASIVSALAGLVMVMVVLGLLRTWIASMRTGMAPAVHKLDKADQICGYLRIAYPVLTLVSILFFVLLIVSLGFAAILSLVIGLVFAVAVVAQCAIIVWMYLDIHNAGTGNESELRKRNQLLKLAGLTFFGAWPAMLSGFGAGIGGAVVWWIWYGIALWPGAFVALDEPVQPAQGGMSAGKYGATPPVPPYQAGAQQPYSAQPDYSQQQQQQYGAPQAAYQPQYQQQYGGQPQQPYQGGYAQ
jgi:hypothetical protein